MQPADDVDFGRSALGGPLCGGDNLLDRHLIRAVFAALAIKGAELAAQRADVGVVDVAIAVVKGLVAVKLYANEVRQPANSVQIATLIDRYPITVRQRLSRLDLCGERFQHGIANRHHRRSINERGTRLHGFAGFEMRQRKYQRETSTCASIALVD